MAFTYRILGYIRFNVFSCFGRYTVDANKTLPEYERYLPGGRGGEDCRTFRSIEKIID